MVLEVNNTKAILSGLLNSSYLAQSKFIDAVLQFTQFCISIGDHSEKLICQAVTFLKQNQSQDQSSKTMLIQCLTSWGKLYYCSNDFQNAMSKLEEAEAQCLNLNNQGHLYTKILIALGDIHVKKNVLNEAEVIFKKALMLYQNDNNLLDKKGLEDKVGAVLSKLAEIYIRQGKLDKAETLY